MGASRPTNKLKGYTAVGDRLSLTCVSAYIMRLLSFLCAMLTHYPQSARTKEGSVMKTRSIRSTARRLAMACLGAALLAFAAPYPSVTGWQLKLPSRLA